MGGSFDTLADKGNAFFWNPAQLSEIENIRPFYGVDLDKGKKQKKNPFDLTGEFDGEVAMSDESEENTIHFYLSAKNSFLREGENSYASEDFKVENMAASLVVSSGDHFGGIAFRRDRGISNNFDLFAGDKWQDDSLYDLNDYKSDALFLGYAFSLDSLSIGFNLKMFNELYNGIDWQGGSLDAGLSLEVIPTLRFSIVFQDLLALVWYDDEMYGDAQDVIYKFTLSFAIPFLNATFSASYVGESGENLYLFPVGIRFDLPLDTLLSFGYVDKKASLGLGLNFGNISFFYTFVYNHKSVEQNHLLSSNYFF